MQSQESRLITPGDLALAFACAGRDPSHSASYGVAKVVGVLPLIVAGQKAPRNWAMQPQVRVKRPSYHTWLGPTCFATCDEPPKDSGLPRVRQAYLPRLVKVHYSRASPRRSEAEDSLSPAPTCRPLLPHPGQQRRRPKDLQRPQQCLPPNQRWPLPSPTHPTLRLLGDG